MRMLLPEATSHEQRSLTSPLGPARQALSSPPRSQLAPFLFLAFTVVVVFILLNIFLAIINDAFGLVHADKQHAQDITQLVKNLVYKKVLRRQMDRMMEDVGHISALLSVGGLLDKIDVDGNGELDPGELEKLLRDTKLSEHFTVKGLIDRFDVDGDGKLSGEELVKMNDAL